ncbi:hypothetical protein J9303_13815 [Bacillaceae bacterium Marseille-Q3522]|nr:hypothetical protein [Bacillaceae bacterium Marseille-Q3522]
MNVLQEKSVMMENIGKTINYLYDAIQAGDFVSAKLELGELRYAVNKMEELKRRTEKHLELLNLVSDLQRKGLNIGFAKKRLNYERNAAKNTKKAASASLLQKKEILN